MAEIERGEHGDTGRARAWMLRAVRARHDPVWTADGYVSDRWRPVSPVTGRLDAFQWQTPLAACRRTRASPSRPRRSRKRCWRRRASPGELAAPRVGDGAGSATGRTGGAGQFTGAALPSKRRRHRYFVHARTPPGTAHPRFRRSFPSCGRRTIQASTMNRQATNSPSRPIRRRPRPAAGAAFCRGGAGERGSGRSGGFCGQIRGFPGRAEPSSSCKAARCPISGARAFSAPPDAPHGPPQ